VWAQYVLIYSPVCLYNFTFRLLSRLMKGALWQVTHRSENISVIQGDYLSTGCRPFGWSGGSSTFLSRQIGSYTLGTVACVTSQGTYTHCNCSSVSAVVKIYCECLYASCPGSLTNLESHVPTASVFDLRDRQLWISCISYVKITHENSIYPSIYLWLYSPCGPWPLFLFINPIQSVGFL
jgi:hypothetical protein